MKVAEQVAVLTAEYASLIAMEFGRNPIVNDEAAFDIFTPSVTSYIPFCCLTYIYGFLGPLSQTRLMYPYARRS